MLGRRGRRALLGGVLTALGAAFASPASAQDAKALADLCSAAGGVPDRCVEAAMAARAVQAQLGLLSGLGSEVAGSAGTLGRRMRTSPRVAFSVRGAFAPVAAPDLADPGDAEAREATWVLPAIHAGLAVGVFDGFSVLPTVGGVLSLDLLASTSLVFPPGGEGFDGRVGALSYGVRLGALRESFTLPGVAVSLTRRSVGDVLFGDVDAGSRAQVDVNPTVTSVRATIGKDLLSVGVIAGYGWDRYGGMAVVTTDQGASASMDDFVNSRRMWFGGASMNFLILQLSAEFGVADGFESAPGYMGAPFDPTSGTAFGSLAFRLTI